MAANTRNALERYASQPSAREEFRSTSLRFSYNLLHRRRNSWAYLALVALGVQSWIDRTHAQGGPSSLDDDSSAGNANGAGGAALNADDRDGLDLAEEAGGDDGAGAGPNNGDGAAGSRMFGPEIIAGADGSGLLARTAVFSSGDGMGGGGGSIRGSLPGSGTPFVIDPGFSFPPFIPVFDYFGGLDSFAEALGLGPSFYGLVDLLPDSAKPLVSVAFGGSDNGLAPVSIWTTLGKFNPAGAFDAKDHFHAEYTVQAIGYTHYGFSHTQGFSDVDNGFLIQFGDAATKSTGNIAQLVDGQDWEGALIVKGNYYEFNTIIQINITWNYDTIDFSTNSGAQGGGAGLISTGGNTQLNEAQILVHEAEALMDAAINPLGITQVISGGINKHNSALQLNVLVQEDTIDFILADVVQGHYVDGAKFGQFADVHTGGQAQHNASLIGTGLNEILPVNMTWREYADYMKNIVQTTAQIVDGDYFEFNTIFQVNLIQDNDTISTSRSAFDGGQAGGAVVASGGNIQLNAASLEKNDSHDYLYVGGIYSQYNLVLQINVLDAQSKITQISDMIHGTANQVADLGDMLGELAIGNGAAGGQASSSVTGMHVGGMLVDNTY